jgi:glucose/arabinose dehydrogenase
MNNLMAIPLILLISVVILLFFAPKGSPNDMALAVTEEEERVEEEREEKDIKPTFSMYDGKPDIKDSRLKLEEVAANIELPTSMAFLGPDDILVLEKDKGTVKRIVNGKMLEKPVLDVNVASSLERGMLGIAIAKNKLSTTVFLYFTEARENNDGTDKCYKYKDKSIHCAYENEPLGNRLYRYDFLNGKLVNPKLILDVPAALGHPIPNRHNGGPVLIGPDQNVYVIIGDVDRKSHAQNMKDGVRPDGSGGILRVTQNGGPVGGGILSNEHPLNLYYAYGIRNGFGLDFDPVTGKLWDTENGDDNFDEVNLIEPGFNSGWRVIMGMSFVEDEFASGDLVDFGGNGKYSDPEFVWSNIVGPTAVKFLGSNKLGVEYENDMFVADVHKGNIYRFELNDERTDLELDGVLEDKVAQTDDELEDIIFGRDFGGITDIEVGPYDGYMYIVSITQGKIYKISSSE